MQYNIFNVIPVFIFCGPVSMLFSAKFTFHYCDGQKFQSSERSINRVNNPGGGGGSAIFVLVRLQLAMAYIFLYTA